jgi:choline dehydrogenase-like flavoprotein
MDHLQGQGAAILPMPVYPFRGPPTTSGIDAFRDGPFRTTSAAFRMSVGNDGWGLLQGPYATALKLVRDEKLFGAALRHRMRDVVTRQFRLSYSTETLPDPDNRVTLSSEVDALGIPRPQLTFKLPDYNRRGFAMGRSVVRQLFEKLGALEINIPDDDRYSAANHIMGTCRMGKDARSSVVDIDCKAHDHPNLFIVGSSAFPTCGTANPTLTVAVLALRSVDAIIKELAA